MDDDEDEKAESLPNLNRLCLCVPTGLVEMMPGRLLGAKSNHLTCYSGFAWSPLGVGCHCMSESVCLGQGACEVRFCRDLVHLELKF